MKRKLFAALAAAALLVTTAGCADSGSSQSEDDTYLLFVDTGLTGATQTASQVALAAIEGAAKVINDAGGINGRQLVVESVDSQGDPTRAVTLLQEKLASGDKPDLVFAGLSSAETLAMLPVLTRNRIPSFGNSSSPAINDPQAYPYHFGFAQDAAAQLNSLKAELNRRGIKKLAVLRSQDAYGDGVANGVKAVGGGDIEIIDTAYNPQDIDLSVAWQRAAGAGADAIYSDCFGDPCPRLFNGRLAAGVTDVPTIFGSGPSATGSGPVGFADEASFENLDVTIWNYLRYVPPAQRTENFNAMYSAVVGTGGQPAGTLLPAIIAWDGVRMLSKAIEAADSGDAEAVVGAVLASAEPPGTWLTAPEGTIKFTAESHFPAPYDGLMIFAKPGPLVDGLFQID